MDAEQNLSLEVQGLFIGPFLANGAIAFIANRGATSPRRQLVAGLASYAVGVAVILAYQAVVSGGVGPLYALTAPILPAVIVWLLVPRKPVTTPGNSALDVVVRAPTQN